MNHTRRGFVLLALIAIAVPLFADSPEYPVGATVMAHAPAFRYSPAAATDGTDFFVVWTDGRTPGRASLIGTRVKRTGEVLEPFGIRIASVAASISSPAIIWDGDAYLVLWTQGNYAGESLQRDEVWSARVDRDGRIAGEPRIISETGKNSTTTTGVYAATNGRVTIVAYRHFEVFEAVRVVVLDAAGNVIHREPIANFAAGLGRGISVAATSSGFVVTWSTNDNRLFASLLDSNGEVIRAPIEIGAGEDLVVASDGPSVAMVWRRWMPELRMWVLLRRDADAQLTQIGEVQTLASNQLIESPSIVRRGDRYEVIAGQRTETATHILPYNLLSVEFNREGTTLVTSRRGEQILASPAHPVSVTNGSDVLVAFRQAQNYGSQIAARIYRDSSPEPATEQVLSWSGNAHTHPVVATSPTSSFAVWLENFSVYATRIDANGNSLDGRGLEIAPNAAAVRVGFDGTNYVVAWVGDRFIGLRSITPAGALLEEVHIPAAVLPRDSFALEVTPDAIYVAWVDESDGRVRVTRIPAGSRAPELSLIVSSEGRSAVRPALGWNGSMLLVAWNELGLMPGQLPNLRPVNVQVARVTGALALADPLPAIIATAETISIGAPSIASNGEDWLVVSERDEQQIIARRVLSNGSVEESAPSILTDGIAPVAMWNGKRYAIAFQSGGNAFDQRPLFLGEVPATGALTMKHRTRVANGVMSVPSIARAANGEVAILYTRASSLPEHTGIERSYFRLMDFTPRRRVVRH